jgi:6-phosphogluconate dehydrogenase
LVEALGAGPRAVWVMLPAGKITEQTIAQLGDLMRADDVIIDGGNTNFKDDVRRARELAPKGVKYLDVGTSGGVWGLARGYCLMIGGDADVVQALDPMFAALAPGSGDSARRGGTAAHGYLHCGPCGAGHFVKMVHNGIEYGLMAAYAEGLNILQHANIGKRHAESDAETTPLRHPEHYQFDFDLAAITEVWRHGSVVTSWLLDLAAAALAKDPSLEGFAGRVSDSGEGRWTLQAANEEGVPAHVLAAALFERFASRGADEFSGKVLSAMRLGFGGHVEKR